MKTGNWIKEVSKVTYHRNGVGGVGFFAVEFKMIDDAEALRSFIATIDTAELMQTRVLCLDDLNEKWRGDRIVHDLQRFLNATTEKALEKKLSDMFYPAVRS